MGNAPSHRSSFFSILASTAWSLAVLLSLLHAPAASAGPLEQVTGQVAEATAPVTEAVETIVPPATTPTAPPAAPSVPTPELPSLSAAGETAGQAGEVATGAVTGAAATATGTVASAQTKVSGTSAQDVAGAGAGDAIQKAASPSTTAAANVGAAASSGAAPSSAPSDGSTGVRDSTPSAAPSAAELGSRRDASSGGRRTGLVGGVPAGLHPFVFVWPAIALVTDSPVGSFIARWTQAARTLYEEGEGASAVPGSADGGRPAQPGAGRSPEPSPSSSPSILSHLNPKDVGFPILLLLLVIPVGLIAFTLVFRYEEGEPLLPRQLTRWRR